MFGGRIKLNAPLVWSKHPGPLFSLALYCFNWTLLPDEPAERDEPLELSRIQDLTDGTTPLLLRVCTK